MHTLRHAHFLARLVLVWFALSLGVAVASPLVLPQTMQLVCAASGAMKLVSSSADGSEAPTLHLLDCSLCVAVAPPPAPQMAAVAAAQPLAFALGRMPAARLAAKTGAPLPPRGPPSLL
jgi:hypothetical protein